MNSTSEEARRRRKIPVLRIGTVLTNPKMTSHDFDVVFFYEDKLRYVISVEFAIPSISHFSHASFSTINTENKYELTLYLDVVFCVVSLIILVQILF